MRDTCLGADKDCSPSTNTVSAALDGAAGNADSHSPVISADGRFVAFSSAATNLLENAPKGRQIYMRDTCTGGPAGCKPSLALISSDPEGLLAGTEAILPSISSSGRFVAFVAITPDATAKDAAARSWVPESRHSEQRTAAGLPPRHLFQHAELQPKNENLVAARRRPSQLHETCWTGLERARETDCAGEREKRDRLHRYRSGKR